jgi:hypothetical protein
MMSRPPIDPEVAMPRRFASSLGFVLAVSVAAAASVACNALNDAPGATARVTPVPTASPIAATPQPSAETPEPAGSGTTQTDTEWGRIWDAIPRSFPVYPGAEPATDVGPPASAQFVIPADVATATTWTKSALDATGLRTTVSGPLEDGSMTLDSVGPNGCAAKTTIVRTGGLTILTVLYGARCPFA